MHEDGTSLPLKQVACLSTTRVTHTHSLTHTHTHTVTHTHLFNGPFSGTTRVSGWLGSRVVSVLDSGAEGPAFKSQSRRCGVIVFTFTFTFFTRVSRYQKGETNLKQETVSGSGISWAICKPAPRSRQITTPVPHHSVFYRPDALPAAQPTASKH